MKRNDINFKGDDYTYEHVVFLGTCNHRVIDHYEHRECSGDSTHTHYDGFAEEVYETGCKPLVKWWCEACAQYVDLAEVIEVKRKERRTITTKIMNLWRK